MVLKITIKNNCCRWIMVNLKLFVIVTKDIFGENMMQKLMKTRPWKTSQWVVVRIDLFWVLYYFFGLVSLCLMQVILYSFWKRKEKMCMLLLLHPDRPPTGLYKLNDTKLPPYFFVMFITYIQPNLHSEQNYHFSKANIKILVTIAQ